MDPKRDELKAKIFGLVQEYYREVHQSAGFHPGKTHIPYSGRVYDEHELVNLVDASLEFWLTAGPYAAKLESRLRKYFAAKDFLLVNSGSSANLLMVSTLCAPQAKALLRSQDLRPLEAGDEVITPAVTFPTTLAPIVQNQLVPVFVDVVLGTYNVDPTLLEQAIGPRTRAIFVPHTLGVPCDMNVVMEVAKRRDLWLLEDCCDGLGATFDGRLVGTFGAMSSLSFYPAHHITMGEGGGIVVNHPRLKRVVNSLRDWGRDCWCDPGESNTCGKRFQWQLGDLPEGYDHKYIYANLGYNFKVTDMQAAIGLAQTEKIERFIAARRRNFHLLATGLKDFQDQLLLPIVDPRANPSPFGFAMTVTNGDRNVLVAHLENHNIATRLVFGGNILRQPGFAAIPKRIAGTLAQTDRVMRDTFFIGVYPGISEPMVDYVVDTIRQYFQGSCRRSFFVVDERLKANSRPST